MVRIILIVVFSFFLTMSSAFAGPDDNPQTSEFDLSPTFEPPRLNLDFRFGAPDYDFVDSVTWDRWYEVEGVYRLELVGIHKALAHQAKRRIRHQAEDDLRRAFHLSNMPWSDFQHRMGSINSEHNPYGEWWNRSWIHSLPPEKGGAPRQPRVETIGWEIRITDDTPLIGWFKKQFDKLGDIWISADHEFDEERGPGVHRNDGRVDNDPNNYGQLKIQEANVGFERPWRWFESGFYHFRFKPTIKFSDSEQTGFVEELALRVQTELYLDNKTLHFGTVSLFVRHNFEEDNTFFSLFFELVTF